ncbi:MAG: energy transducer TonB [Bacteroidota bacterium]|jgi:protein TonB|nr:TonB family protein [Bacteroidota bacterium]MCA6442343.1 TonB family protein [Bacteroidota bacterium]
MLKRKTDSRKQLKLNVMNIPVNNQQKLNEVIFANKNKAYGAYEIRSTYGETLFKSLAIVALTFGSLMSLGYYFTHRTELPTSTEITQLIPDIITEVNINKPVDMDKPKSTPVDPTPSNANKPNSQAVGTIVKDSLVVETNSTSINTDVTGTSTSSTQGTGDPTNTGSSGTGSLTNNGNGAGGNENDVRIFADEAPEFEGGLSALYRFISSKIVYPNGAREAGKEGTAYVRFVVDETGGVTNVITQNKLGFGLDEEARRVITLLPKFKKPGYVNKQPVKVYYNIPIKFSMAK